MERLKQHFISQGLTPADLPKAIIIHEVAHVLSSWMLFWQTFLR